jgi:ribosomal protein S18 acetylase RimI-like enzyme
MCGLLVGAVHHAVGGGASRGELRCGSGADIAQYLLFDGETPIGYGELWLDDEEDEVELARIIVAPQHRGKGLGVRLVQALLAQALTADQSSIFLRVRPDNTPAIRTYERVGFQPVDAALAAEWNAPQPIDYAWFQYPKP